MEELQNTGQMDVHLKSYSKEIGSGEWSKLVDVVHEQVYSRVVGPYSNELAVSRITIQELNEFCIRSTFNHEGEKGDETDEIASSETS